MKKSNVIPLLPDELEKLLAKFRENHRLADFLEALSCMAIQNVDSHSAWTTWRKHKDKATSNSCLNEILDWCAQFKVDEYLFDELLRLPGSSMPGNGEQIAKTELLPETEIEAAHSAGRLAAEASNIYGRYYDAMLQNPDNLYGGIAAAWPLKKILEQTFGEDDPARYIARFIKVMFAEQNVQHEAKPSRILCNVAVLRFVQGELIVWALEAERAFCKRNIDQTDKPGVKVTAECRMDQLAEMESQLELIFSLVLLPADKIGLENKRLSSLPALDGAVKILPYLPQKAFEHICASLCSIFANKDDESAIKNAFGIFVDIVTALPLGMPYGNLEWAEYEEKIPSSSWLDKIRLNIYPITSLPFLPVAHLQNVLYMLSQRIDSIPYEFDARTIGSDGYLTIPVLRERIVQLAAKFTEIRRNRFDGKTPLSTEALESANHWFENIFEYLRIQPEFDASMRLAITPDKAEFCFYFLSAPPNRDDREPERISHFGKSRMLDFIRTYRSIRREGWDELANACLALFLVSQSAYFNGRLYVDWSVFGKLMERASKLPRGNQVALAASYAYQLCKKRSESIDTLVLSGWATHVTKIDDATLDEAKSISAIDRSTIQNELIQDVGKENWLKIFPQTIRQLVDAETQWSALHRQIGKGYQDFGSFANAYVKAIECELLARLDVVFTGAAYQEYYRDKNNRAPDRHTTLGPMLHTLKDFDLLPDNLKAAIEGAGLRVHEDKQLIKDLLDATYLRNKGSHPAPFTEKHLLELRKLMFEKGLLRRLFDKC